MAPFITGPLERGKMRGDDGHGFESGTNYQFGFHYNCHGIVSIEYGRDKNVTQSSGALGSGSYRTSSCRGDAWPY